MSPETIRALRNEGRHEEALAIAVELSARPDADAQLLYETAAVHDSLGREAEAVPYYVRAIAAGLPQDQLRGAYLGLGSTYRTLGKSAESLAVLDQGLQDFPDANELVVFRAMALYNAARHKEALASLLGVIARTTDDPNVERYRRAIEFYAEDLDRTWT